ncbi:MAG TPA: type VI secretion system tube protein Hcp [Bdellovibrio sp.]|nr:type VI secretion system tube protein Hcp [Bdellovibrio sp.]
MRENGTEMILTFEGLNDSPQGNVFNESIEILAWSHGISFGKGTENETPRAYFQDISMTKFITPQSPAMYRFCSEGKVIKAATFTSANKNQLITMKLKDVMITAVSTGGSGGEDRLTENIVLHFGSIEVFYENRMNEKNSVTTSNVLDNNDTGPTLRSRYY